MSGKQSIRVARAAALVAAYEENGEEFLFVENADGSTVHVSAPDGTPPDPDEHPLFLLARGVVLTVCSRLIVCNRGGLEENGRLTADFEDERLCAACHKAFGDKAPLIFEINRREVDQ